MAIVPIAGAKGSTGVTTAALLAGAVWSKRRYPPVVMECDPGGGDIAALYDLEVIPGIVSLAAELERSGDVDPTRAAELITSHAQTLAGGLRVVVAPTSPEELRLPLERLAEDLPSSVRANSTSSSTAGGWSRPACASGRQRCG